METEENFSSNEINELKHLFQQQQQEANQTIQELLSSVRQLKQEYLCSLTSVPLHPYEKFKTEYICSDTKPLLIEEIPQPEDFCLETCSKQISSICTNLHEQWSHQVCLLSCNDSNEENLHLCNAFASLSENVLVVDKKRVENHLLFVEMIKNIPIQLIEQQPKETAEKIISQFIKLYQAP